MAVGAILIGKLVAVLLVLVAVLFIALVVVLMLVASAFEPEPAHPYRREDFERMIRNSEVEEDIELTDAARAMLAIPLAELEDLGLRLEPREFNKSLGLIFSTLRESEPAPFERQGEPYRSKRRYTSIAVIRAFAERFCNIPPFCSRREGGGR